VFDLGFQELVVIFVVALLVFGPKKLPELARNMGKGLGQLRKAMLDIKSEVEKEVEETSSAVKHEVPSWKDTKAADHSSIGTIEAKEEAAASAEEGAASDSGPDREADPGGGAGQESPGSGEKA
jgi:Tat protein translocase TatB subunit